MHKFDVITIGDLNPDIIAPGFKKLPKLGEEIFVDDLTMNIGGGAALFAAGMSKLGMRVSCKSVIGNDIYGDFLLNELKRLKIDTSEIKRSSMKTGVTLVLTNNEDRGFITYKGTNSKIDYKEITEEYLNTARHLHLTGYCNENHDIFINLIKMAKSCGLTVSLDVGWDDTGSWNENIYEILKLIDIFIPNQTEAINYTKSSSVEEALAKLSKLTPLVVIKLGSKGSVGKIGDRIVKKQSYKVDCKDTTGAGDSFDAGLIYSFLKGFDIEKCLVYANACGALSTTDFGGNTKFPLLEELESFIANN